MGRFSLFVGLERMNCHGMGIWASIRSSVGHPPPASSTAQLDLSAYHYGEFWSPEPVRVRLTGCRPRHRLAKAIEDL
jgi:hypothetical protein